MNTLEDSLEFTLDRAYSSYPAMVILEAAPYNWTWDGISPEAFWNLIRDLQGQRVALSRAEARLSLTAAIWEQELQRLLEDALTGAKLGRVQFKQQPVKASLFEALRFRTAGREGRYRQALRFEQAWKRADAAWVFKPGLTLADFRARRKAIPDLEESHAEAEANERFARAELQHQATTLNGLCVDWYEAATATFAERTVAGMLVRTIPTTYDPNRAPGPLKLNAKTEADGESQLSWGADRGVRFYILAQGPNDSGFVLIIDGVREKKWTLRKLAPGLWRFKGYAENRFGKGAESEVVELQVPAVKAA